MRLCNSYNFIQNKLINGIQVCCRFIQIISKCFGINAKTKIENLVCQMVLDFTEALKGHGDKKKKNCQCFCPLRNFSLTKLLNSPKKLCIHSRNICVLWKNVFESKCFVSKSIENRFFFSPSGAL